MQQESSYLNDLDAVKKATAARALSASTTLTPEDLSSLLAACKTASEAEKAEVEKSQLLKAVRSEAIRFWIPIAASFLSVAILASTLILQTRQFQTSVEQNTKSLNQQRMALDAQREANEDTQWREALKLMADKQGQLVNDAAGVALLKHFATSTHVGPQARDLAVFMLSYVTEPAVFETLFRSAVNPKTTEGFNTVVRINRSLSALNSRIASQIEEMEAAKRKGQSITLLPLPDGKTNQVPIQQAIQELRSRSDSVLQEITMTGATVVATMNSDFKIKDLNLSQCFFYDNNFANANFSGANISGTGFAVTNVDGADFTSVVVDSIGNWSETPWWRAAKITPTLLSKLLAEYPFPPHKTQYLNSSREQYERDVQRLKKG
ncbi:MAG: pentapeptide repeat-containing protein [Leptothrix sp. (in: b-proteobacteria)]